MPQEGSDTQVLEKDEVEIQEPKMYNVILINDDYTPMDFVVYVLMEIFHKNSEDAWSVTMDVHKKGKGIAGTYVQDVAETKSMMANKLANANSFPLETEVEEV